MANLCRNLITIKHENPEVIERFVRAFNNRELFREFIPIPPDVASWYEWAMENWGTTRDAGAEDDESLEIISPNEVYISVITAYGPPIAIFDHWVDIGCDVEADYYELGMWFAGTYKNKLKRPIEEEQMDQISKEFWDTFHDDTPFTALDRALDTLKHMNQSDADSFYGRTGCGGSGRSPTNS
jgi:hypothetical protein